MQARLSATFEGARPSQQASGGAAAAALAASLSAFRAVSATRTSLLGEQRLEAEVGIGHAQPTHGLEEGIRCAGFAHATCPRAPPPSLARSHGLAKLCEMRNDGTSRRPDRETDRETDRQTDRETHGQSRGGSRPWGWKPQRPTVAWSTRNVIDT
eukprot:scaffold29523_cov69-Phaeocystis_antarctica.AAC.5